jgi:hypothetical protein
VTIGEGTAMLTILVGAAEVICLAFLCWGAWLCLFGKDRRTRSRQFKDDLMKRRADKQSKPVLQPNAPPGSYAEIGYRRRDDAQKRAA